MSKPETFQYALKFTLGIEGGLSDNKADKGGRTNYGITQLIYDKWRMSKSQQKQDVALITLDEATSIYRVWYWTPSRCDMLPDKLAVCMFDAMVNHNPTTAMMLMQAATGVAADGAFGPKTLKAFTSVKDEKAAVRLFTDARVEHYCNLCKQDTTQVEFINGWMNRAFKLERELTS